MAAETTWKAPTGTFVVGLPRERDCPRGLWPQMRDMRGNLVRRVAIVAMASPRATGAGPVGCRRVDVRATVVTSPEKVGA